MQQLRKRMGLDHDAGRHAGIAITHGDREWRAMTVDQGQVRTNEDDLVLHPRLGKRRSKRFDGVARILDKCMVIGIAGWRAAPDDGHLCRRRRHASGCSERTREAWHVSLAGHPARKDPAHGVRLIGPDIGERARFGRYEILQVLDLVLVLDCARLGVSDDQRHFYGFERRSEFIVLAGLRLLIKKKVDADGAGVFRGDGLEKLADEIAIDGRAVRQRRHRLLVHGDDDDVRIARLGRCVARDQIVFDVAVRACEERDLVDRISRAPSRETDHHQKNGNGTRRAMAPERGDPCEKP